MPKVKHIEAGYYADRSPTGVARGAYATREQVGPGIDLYPSERAAELAATRRWRCDATRSGGLVRPQARS